MEFKLVLSVILMVLMIFIGIVAFVKIPSTIARKKMHDIFDQNPVADQLQIENYNIYYECHLDSNNVPTMYLHIDNITLKNVGDSELNVTPYFEIFGNTTLPQNDKCSNVVIEPGEEKNLSECGEIIVKNSICPIVLDNPTDDIELRGRQYIIGSYIVFVGYSNTGEIEKERIYTPYGGYYDVNMEYFVDILNGGVLDKNSNDYKTSITSHNQINGLSNFEELQYDVTPPTQIIGTPAEIKMNFTSLSINVPSPFILSQFNQTIKPKFKNGKLILYMDFNSTYGHPWERSIERPDGTLEILFMDLTGSEKDQKFQDELDKMKSQNEDVNKIIYDFPTYVIQYDEIPMKKCYLYNEKLCRYGGKFLQFCGSHTCKKIDSSGSIITREPEINVFDKGTTTYTDNSGKHVKEDECTSNGELEEYYCTGGYHSYSEISCACSDGKCSGTNPQKYEIKVIPQTLLNDYIHLPSATPSYIPIISNDFYVYIDSSSDPFASGAGFGYAEICKSIHGPCEKYLVDESKENGIEIEVIKYPLKVVH